MKLKLKSKILMMVLSIIILLSITTLTITYIKIVALDDNNTKKQLDSNIAMMMKIVDYQYAGDWNVTDGKLYKGKWLMNENYDFVDSIKKITNNEATVFLKDTRIATTVVDKGNRAIGTKAANEVVDQVINKGIEYSGEAKILGKPYEVKYIPVKDQNNNILGMMFVGISKADLAKQVNSLMFSIGLATVFIGFISFLLVYVFTKGMTKSLSNTARHMGSTAQGDLSINVPEKFLKRTDEIGDLSKALNKMQESLRTMMKNVHSAALKIDEESEELKNISNGMLSSSKDVSASVQNVAEGASEQAVDLIEISSTADKFGYEIREMANFVEDIQGVSKIIGSMAQESNSEMNSLTASIENISEIINRFSTKINEFDSNIKKINEISLFINSISEQTNMLALNAAIEAARAGESGRGFAVVADEVRKLAEQSRKSSDDINTLISSISENMSEVIAFTDNINGVIDGQANTISSTTDSFKGIVVKVGEIIPKIEDLNARVMSINKQKDFINERVNGASSVAEEVSASTQEIAAASEVMNTSAESVSNASEALRNMTREMIQEVSKFKLI